MKKILTVACILMCALMLFACAEKPAEVTQPAATIDVYVTLSNAGDLVVKQEKITVTDLNGDKKFNIDETLAAAHKAKGKAADYASGTKEGYDGVSLLKMWGDDSGWFSYYVNDISAWSLADEVKEGDYVSAFVFKDKEYGSDSYSYFTTRNATVVKNEEFVLSLKNSGYVPVFDGNGDPVMDETSGYQKYELSIVPTAGANITINGAKGEIVTDENGLVKLSINNPGTYTISAVSDTLTLVPAVCVVTVK